MRNSLSIVHVARSPVGGIFRHIADLATAQHAAGHAVGLICDSTSGGALRGSAHRGAEAAARARRGAAPDGPLDRPGRPAGDALPCRARIARDARPTSCMRMAPRAASTAASPRRSSAAAAATSRPSTRRMAAASTTTAASLSGRALFRRRARAGAADRRADPRLGLRGGDLSREGRRAALPGACRAERPAAGGIRAGRRRRRTPPISSSSASCAS